jgi:PAT family beta-lactamase induction signal transducer AmpG
MIKRVSVNFFNPRLMAALLLGFSSGLPLALTGSTLQAWFTDANVNLAAIGALSLIGVPYTLKFLWSPFLDFYQLPKLGMRKGWIIVTQLGVAAALWVIASMNPATEVFAVSMLALVTAFFAATQDIAIDAYRTDILKEDERGLGAAYYVFGYRVAVLASGAFALIFADYFSWALAYKVMAALMLILAVVTFRTPKIHHAPTSEPNIWASMLIAFKDMASRKNITILLLFVVLYKIGDALALSLMTNFLLHGLGFTKTEIGLAYKGVSFVATVLGAFVGGAILTRKSLYYGLVVFGVAQAFSNLMFVFLAMAGKNFALMALSIFIENFCSGLSTIAFMAFMMMMCNKKYTASQYALLSAIASLGRVALGPVAAAMVTSWGWTWFYIWSFLLSFPGILLLMLLKEKVMIYALPAEQTS